MLALQDQPFYPLHFQMEKLRISEAKQSIQDHTASWNRGRLRVTGESLEELDPTRGYLLHSPAAREEVAIVMAMQGDVEHTGVLVEGVLGAIAMMNILWEMGSGLGKV